MDYIWLIPLVPAAGAALNGLLGIRLFSKKLSASIACTAMGVAFALSLWAFWQLLGLPAEARSHAVSLGDWIPSIPLATSHGIGALHVPWGFRLDPLSAMMILVVSGIGFLIHVYSTAYMHEESRGAYARFFAYLNLFVFFMLTLVLGDNFLVMFVGWEGVGLCSYLLIGFYYLKKSATDAGKKAFLVNRIGDFGFLLGTFLIFVSFGTLDFQAVAEGASKMPVEAGAFGLLSTIGLLLFVGATGKSAQIPLYVWLPDAMEGPTPVSALIHAATMVTAGVYMVARNAVLFTHAPMALEVVAIVGALTALMAASIGLVQRDIKRVLAYSTVSQLGYMFLALGMGAFAAGTFHLMTHAFFKALLFLGSGAVIHGMAGEQDMRNMGGLKKYLPITYVTMLIGTLAIAGIPPLAGFFSKDEILFRTFLGNKVLWTLAALTALMTAFYMFRLMSLTFFGQYRGPAWEHDGGHGQDAHGASDAHGGGHGAWHGPHEAPAAMSYVLVVLAVGAALAGFVGVPAALGGSNIIETFLEPSFTVHETAAAAAGETAAAPGALALAEVGQQAHPASASGASLAEAGAGQATHPAPASGASRAEAGAGQATHPAPAEAGHMSRAGELGLMGLSVVIGVFGIFMAYRFFVVRPEIAEGMATRFAGPHRVLLNKYYVDELYHATVVRGTMSGANGLWTFDRNVVDGAVNGSGWVTIFSSWISHLADKHIVDGLVNLVGTVMHEASYRFRRLQTGLIQNYALLMVFGVFVFISVYLLVR